ncbi:hypothetical protein VCRA2114E365_200025 [Vibrio crassostreae]|nr:hypothetical protein VCRA2113O351_160026 [Vibrio crassostreae]CAK1795816.1 hypothetical protein VCRA2115O371_170025 [Vibrio crassostreae]CAK1798662.1 hypothetical protein VCRA2117O378_170054 [Vibrio crassostreae]CAK1802386.1 hypothetical protein VCRA2113O356_170054 [Vibrio crassostreae]CAK1810042.1 hypothetical protein VCRA2117O376_180025 [Vibrio crassostreae]
MKLIFFVFTDSYRFCLFLNAPICFIYKIMTLLLSVNFYWKLRFLSKLICASVKVFRADRRINDLKVSF